MPQGWYNQPIPLSLSHADRFRPPSLNMSCRLLVLAVMGTAWLWVSGPKPHRASDYCYSDRLHNRSYDLVLQPMAFRFCFLWQNRRAVLLSLSFGRIFRDGVSFRLRSQFPEEPSPVSVDWWPKPFVSLKPCDLVVERTFPDF
jgi:hypothetical protein